MKTLFTPTAGLFNNIIRKALKLIEAAALAFTAMARIDSTTFGTFNHVISNQSSKRNEH